MQKLMSYMLIVPWIALATICQAKNWQGASEYTSLSYKSCKTIEAHDNEEAY